jgi:hypothetical protein
MRARHRAPHRDHLLFWHLFAIAAWAIIGLILAISVTRAGY